MVSYPTNNSVLCSLLDRNFGVILHRTLRDGYMIQLYYHCWEIALGKVCTLGLIFHHCNIFFVPIYYLLPCYFYLFRLQKYISTIHITLLSPSLRWTCAPIEFSIVFLCWGQKRFLVFGCRLVWERPSSSYTSHGLINLRPSTWGKIATVLQNSVLGVQTPVYKNKVA